MKPNELSEYLAAAIPNNWPTLVKSKPGFGKSDILKKAAKEAKTELIISHPVVSDPTDYKGLPFPSKDGLSADFLPYGDLRKLIQAKSPLTFFIDDLGQAPKSVQAACMQLLLAREINGHKISPDVRFVAATNGLKDNAGVSVILNPVKSRFVTILTLEVDVEDWVKWAIESDMPPELTAFVRFKPDILDGPAVTNDIVNTSCPRTLYHVGMQQRDGLKPKFYLEVFSGSAGPAFGQEYSAFLAMADGLPSIDSIIKDPEKSIVPKDPSVIYTIIGGLSRKMEDTTITPICKYLARLKPEFSVACMADGVTKNPSVCDNNAYVEWAKKMKTFMVPKVSPKKAA
jgi:hypothetical protein